jgi:hypothetical protein
MCTVDKHGSVHPIAFQITSSQSKSSVQKLLAATKAWVHRLFDVKLEDTVKFTMADGAPELEGALKVEFPTATPLVCFFHIKAALTKTGDKKTWRSLMQDQTNFDPFVKHFTTITKTLTRAGDINDAFKLLLAEWQAKGEGLFVREFSKQFGSLCFTRYDASPGCLYYHMLSFHIATRRVGT